MSVNINFGATTFAKCCLVYLWFGLSLREAGAVRHDKRDRLNHLSVFTMDVHHLPTRSKLHLVAFRE